MPDQGTEDRIDDLTIGSVVFAAKRKGLSTDVGALIDEATLEEAMKGSTQLSVDLYDRDYEALNSGLFADRVRVEVDKVGFRLAQVSLVDDFKLQALFEHELIAAMRENTKPKKAQRGTGGGGVNRAQFILSMLRELHLPYRFICPELNRVQPTPPPDQVSETVGPTPENQGEGEGGQSATPHLKHAKRGKGVSKTGLTVKGAPMTEAQATIITEALGVAEALGASQLAMEALVVALIQENSVSNPDPGEPGDRGALSLIDSTIGDITAHNGHGNIDPYNVGEVSAHFLAAGYFRYGGAIDLAKKHPTYSPSKIGTMVQGPEVEYPSKWNAEASRIVVAYTGGQLPAGVSSSSQSQASTVLRTATFEFTRGLPEQIEDTFSCATRLAEQVGWSFFVSGKRDIYFVNDLDLLKSRPRYIVEPDTPGVEKLTYDLEVGNRTTIQSGKRKLKPSEAVLVVRLNMNAAPPGTVIELKGWGPADGKWLVEHAERSPFDARTTIMLRAPQKPKEEPRAELGTSETATGAREKAKELGHSGTASRSAEAKLQADHPELHEGVRRVVAIILTQYPDLIITSTTNHSRLTTSGNVSLHSEGRAADLAYGPPYSRMDPVGTWIAHNVGSLLTEGIHNPTLSIKNGAVVPSSYWGSSTWAEHINHIHVGV